MDVLILMVAVVIVATALGRYLTFAAAGRLKAGADGISQTLFNPQTSRTVWDVSPRRVRDTADTAGVVRSEVIDRTSVSRSDQL